tara:strand:- start:2 stop:229 length:228 start_codon:yes stop_codon:yes gene_type:complete
MPNKNNCLKSLRLNVHAPCTGCTLIIIALTQIPVGIKNFAELACIGQTSNKIWALEKNLSEEICWRFRNAMEGTT